MGVIRGDALVEMLRSGRDVVLRGVRVDGPVVLKAVDVGGLVDIRESSFSGAVDFRGVRFSRAVILEGCRFLQGLALADARIGGVFNVERAKLLPSPAEEKDATAFQRAEVRADWVGLHVAGELRARQLKLGNGSPTAGGKVRPYTLNLRAAQFGANVWLCGVRIPGSLRLMGCRIEGFLDASVESRGPRLRTFIGHEIELQEAQISGQVSLNGSVVGTRVNLLSAELSGPLFCEVSNATRLPMRIGCDGTRISVQFSSAKIRGDIRLQGADLKGAIHGCSAEITGSFRCRNEVIHNPSSAGPEKERDKESDKKSLEPFRTVIGRDLRGRSLDLCGARITGAVFFSGAKFCGAIYLENTKVGGPVLGDAMRRGFCPTEVGWDGDPAGRQPEGMGRSMVFTGLDVGGSVKLDGAILFGSVILDNSRVGGSVTGNGFNEEIASRMPGGSSQRRGLFWIRKPDVDGRAIGLAGANVDGNVEFQGARIWGEVDGSNSEIGGWVHLGPDRDLDRFTRVGGGPSLCSLRFEGARVLGRVDCTGMQSLGEINFRCAKLGGDLLLGHLETTRLRGRLGAGADGTSLQLQRTEVAGNVSLCGALLRGQINAQGAEIGGSFLARSTDKFRTEIGCASDGISLWLLGVRVRGYLQLSGACLLGGLILEAAQVGGDLLCGVKFGHPVLIAGAVTLRSIEVVGGVDMRGVRVLGLADGVIRSEAADDESPVFQARGAHFHSVVNMSGGVVMGTVELTTLKADGSVDLGGLWTSADVDLTDAVVEGSLNLDGTRRHPTTGGDRPTRVGGMLRLLRARVGGDLTVGAGRYGFWLHPTGERQTLPQLSSPTLTVRLESCHAALKKQQCAVLSREPVEKVAKQRSACIRHWAWCRRRVNRASADLEAELEHDDGIQPVVLARRPALEALARAGARLRKLESRLVLCDIEWDERRYRFRRKLRRRSQKLRKTYRRRLDALENRFKALKDQWNREVALDLRLIRIAGRLGIEGRREGTGPARVLGTISLEGAAIADAAAFEWMEVLGSVILDGAKVGGAVGLSQVDVSLDLSFAGAGIGELSLDSNRRLDIGDCVVIDRATLQRTIIHLGNSDGPTRPQGFRPRRIGLVGTNAGRLELMGALRVEDMPHFNLAGLRFEHLEVDPDLSPGVKPLPLASNAKLCARLDNWLRVKAERMFSVEYRWIPPKPARRSTGKVAWVLFGRLAFERWVRFASPRALAKNRYVYLLRQMRDFDEESFVTIENWLRNRGQQAEADQVYLEMRRRERPLDRWPKRFVHWCLLNTVGFGVRSSNAVFLWLMSLLASMFLLSQPASVEHPQMFLSPETGHYRASLREYVPYGRGGESMETALSRRADDLRVGYGTDGGVPVSWGWDDAFWVALRVNTPGIDLYSRGEWEPASRNLAEWGPIKIEYEDVATALRCLGFPMFALILGTWTGLLKRR